MRRPGRRLTTLFALLSCGSTRSLLRGWDPAVSVGEAARDGRFFCVDGLADFPLAALNDDYCDCTDGSDEPGTAACSHLTSATFFCANSGWRSQNLRSSRVDDGVCDCCDGTDEAAGQCPDICRQLAEVRVDLPPPTEGRVMSRARAFVVQHEHRGLVDEIRRYSAGLDRASHDGQLARSQLAAMEAAKAELRSIIPSLESERKVVCPRIQPHCSRIVG
jgi:protein kinase C substrate 80K-H